MKLLKNCFAFINTWSLSASCILYCQTNKRFFKHASKNLNACVISYVKEKKILQKLINKIIQLLLWLFLGIWRLCKCIKHKVCSMYVRSITQSHLSEISTLICYICRLVQSELTSFGILINAHRFAIWAYIWNIRVCNPEHSSCTQPSQIAHFSHSFPLALYENHIWYT